MLWMPWLLRMLWLLLRPLWMLRLPGLPGLRRLWLLLLLLLPLPLMLHSLLLLLSLLLPPELFPFALKFLLLTTEFGLLLFPLRDFLFPLRISCFFLAMLQLRLTSLLQRCMLLMWWEVCGCLRDRALISSCRGSTCITVAMFL